MDFCLGLYSIPLVNIDTLVPKLFIIYVSTRKMKFFHFVLLQGCVSYSWPFAFVSDLVTKKVLAGLCWLPIKKKKKPLLLGLLNNHLNMISWFHGSLISLL